MAITKQTKEQSSTKARYRLPALLLLCGMAHSSLASVEIYSTDFESGAGSEWSNRTTDNSFPSQLTRFSGRFGAESQTLSLSGLIPGGEYCLNFDLVLIDSWDGTNPWQGGDYFRVAIGGVTRFDHSFFYDHSDPNWPSWQSYHHEPDVLYSPGLGYSPINDYWSEAIYKNIGINFTATGPNATITFSGTANQGLDDESWGIDNVSVSAVPEPTTVFTGALLLIPAGTALIGRRRKLAETGN